MLLVLVFILFEEIGRSLPLIPDVPYLLFHDISLFPFLGLIAGIRLFALSAATWCKPCHNNAKCEIQLSFRRSVITLYHIHAWERLGIDLHGILTQDQLALLNSRLDLPTEFFAVASVMSEGMMPLVI
jgi:hypothetical protein